MNYEKLILSIPKYIGTTNSIIIHSMLFIAIYSMLFFGVSLDTVNLTLTTIVSLEAIYLSIFIQLSVNQNTNKIEAELDQIQDGIDEIEEVTKPNIFTQINTNRQKSINEEIVSLQSELQQLNTKLTQLGFLLESKSKI